MNNVQTLTVTARDLASPVLRAIGASMQRLSSIARSVSAGMASAFRGTLSVVSTLAQSFMSLAGTAARAGGVLGGAFAVGLGALGKAGVDMNVTLATVQRSITTIGGSAKGAEQFITALRKEAMTSVLTFKDMLPLAQSLSAVLVEQYGSRGLGRVIPVMRAFGDVAATLGVGIEDQKLAIRGFRQLMASDVPTREDMKQVDEALPGAGVMGIIKKQFGSTDGEVLKKAGVTGARVAEAVIAGMQKKFGGAQVKAAGTLPIILSNFKDAFNNVAAAVTSKFEPVLTRSLGKVLKMVEGLANNQKFIAGLSSIFEILGVAIEAAVSHLPGLIDWLTKIVTVKNVVGVFLMVAGGIQQAVAAGRGFLTWAGQFLPLLGLLVTGLGAVAAQLPRVVAWLGKVITLDSVSTVLATIAGGLLTVWQEGQAFVAWASAALVNVWNVVSAAAVTGLSTVAGFIKTVWDTGAAFVNWISGGKGLKGIWEEIKNAAWHAIDFIIRSWNALVAGFQFLQVHAPALFQPILDAINKLADALEKTDKWLTELNDGLMAVLSTMTQVGLALHYGFTQAINDVTTLTRKVGDFFNFLTNMWAHSPAFQAIAGIQSIFQPMQVKAAGAYSGGGTAVGGGGASAGISNATGGGRASAGITHRPGEVAARLGRAAGTAAMAVGKHARLNLPKEVLAPFDFLGDMQRKMAAAFGAGDAGLAGAQKAFAGSDFNQSRIANTAAARKQITGFLPGMAAGVGSSDFAQRMQANIANFKGMLMGGTMPAMPGFGMPRSFETAFNPDTDPRAAPPGGYRPRSQLGIRYFNGVAHQALEGGGFRRLGPGQVPQEGSVIQSGSYMTDALPAAAASPAPVQPVVTINISAMGWEEAGRKVMAIFEAEQRKTDSSPSGY